MKIELGNLVLMPRLFCLGSQSNMDTERVKSLVCVLAEVIDDLVEALGLEDAVWGVGTDSDDEATGDDPEPQSSGVGESSLKDSAASLIRLSQTPRTRR